MKTSLAVLLPCVAVLTGCIATTVPDSFRLTEESEAALRRTNWRVASVDVAGLTPSENSAIRATANERLRERSDPALEPVPVSVVVSVREREVDDRQWTVLPWVFTAFVFPGITDTAFDYTLALKTPLDAWDVSGTAEQSCWLSLLSLPVGVVYGIARGEPLGPVDIVPEAILAQLTPERYERTIGLARAEREAAEAFAEQARKDEEERAAAAERARREEEERRAAEERRWLARKDDPAYRFPLRDGFPDSAPVYRVFRTGCSLAWAEEYIRREGYATTNRVRSFPDMAAGVSGATERPLPEEFDRVEETETSLFVHSPTNITFFDDGRFVTLTFGSPSPDGAERVLVSGEIQFPDGGATVEALAKKYEAEVPGSRRKASEETVTEGGQTILPLVRLPVYTIRKALVVLSSEKTAVRILDNRAVSLFWDSPSSQQIHVDEEGKVSLGNDDLELRLIAAPQLSGEEVGKAFAMWSSANERCGKPAVSIVDRVLFKAMVAAKEEAARAAAAAQRKEREDAAERRRREMEKRLESF